MNYHKPLPKEQYERISAEMSQSKMAHGGDVKGMIDYEIQMRGICKNHNCTIDQYRASEKMYKEGGNIAEENREMVANNNKQIAHHTKELANTLKKADEVPAWVVAKVNRSASDLSDVTHYLDGEIEYAKGGRMPSISEANIKDLEGEYVEFYAMGVEETKTYRIANARVSPKIFTKRDVTLIFEDGADAIMPLEKLDDYLKGKTISLTDYKGEKYAIKRVGKMAKGGKTGLLRNGKYTYEKGDEGMYEGNEVRVVKYEIGSEMYVFDILNEDGKVIDHNVAKKDKFEKQFAYFPKKAKGGVTELRESDQHNLNDVLADARKLSISQKTPMYVFQRPSGDYVIADDEDSKMYELDKMNSRFVTFYANGKKYEDGGMMAKGGQTQKEYIAEKVGKVMHEFKQGDLRSSSGQKVTNPKQAIAIGLSEGRAGWKHKRKK